MTCTHFTCALLSCTFLYQRSFVLRFFDGALTSALFCFVRLCALSFEKRRIIFKSFVESQFKYCPLIWMFHGRLTNNKINRLHERALRIVYNDYESTFEQLLINDKPFCIHHQNIHKLMIEIYKTLNDIDNTYSNIFVRISHNVNLRLKPDLLIPSVKSVLKGKRYFGSLMWNSLPINI